MRNPDKYISIISKIANNRTVGSNEGFQTVTTYLFFEKRIYFNELSSYRKDDGIFLGIT